MQLFCLDYAIIVPSLLFGVLHIIGMDFDFLSCALVLVAGTLVGVMFSLITIETNSIYTYVIRSKSFMITGGDFGIESSVISAIAYAIVSFIAFIGIKNNIKTHRSA
ncbi:MAG: hypothetical protein RSD28_01015 [Lachnospiraceae bacterium]